MTQGVVRSVPERSPRNTSIRKTDLVENERIFEPNEGGKEAQTQTDSVGVSPEGVCGNCFLGGSMR